MANIILKNEETETFIRKVAADFHLDIRDRQQYEYAEEIARTTEEIVQKERKK